MKTYANQLIFDNNMRSLLRNGDIEWAVECQITNEGSIVKVSYQPKDIKKLLHNNKGFLKTFHIAGHVTMVLNTNLSWKLVHIQ